MTKPDYIFESSWEVCNKVGGIHTVLSTKARTLKQQLHDNLIFIGPDHGDNVEFCEDRKLFAAWRKSVAKDENIPVRAGRWNICGNPIVILVDFRHLYDDKNMLYYSMWETFGVDSSKAYGDYDESCVFAYAAAKAIRHFCQFNHLDGKHIIAQFHEWTTGMGALYLRKHLPSVATIFTTHATTVGRSISGNNKPLYGYLDAYNGDQMAYELNIESKHSVEKQAAHRSDCFTTVSEITATECRQLLERAPDVITPNGFEPDFVPAAEVYADKRAAARATLLRVASKLLGCEVSKKAFLISVSGRYEYRNKGIDVFIDVMNRLRQTKTKREIIAFVMVPAWVFAARADLKAVLDNDITTTEPMQTPFLTHWINRMDDDLVMNYLYRLGFSNAADEKVKIFFVPCYLNGADGIFNRTYYDLLPGMDCTVFPSYYEPWGYTPLESTAFGVPTVTTDLAGFGQWAETMGADSSFANGVAVVHRTDDNYHETVAETARCIASLIKMTAAEREAVADKCRNIATRAEWQYFIASCYKAYDMALKSAKKRMDKKLA
ncbi:MAG: glycogen/starch synthase [Tannerella sp.]|jgi:glycosyltransferase involved in cell wall biosynthesis|nr:glycogen/starch synthase [Tannerella sp.]